MNQKPLVLRIVVWPLLFFAVMTLAELWAYMVGSRLILGALDIEMAHATLQAMVVVMTAMLVVLTWPLLAPKDWRAGWTTIVTISINIIANGAWQNWIQFWPDSKYQYDFAMSVFLVTIGLVLGASACIKFIMSKE